MAKFHFFTKTDIDAGVAQFQADPKGVLLDVRTPEEYLQQRIPHSDNLPLQEIAQARERFPDLDTPFYVYCRSGARSSKAAAALKKMGYTCVNNIGGIMEYRGETVQGEA